MISDQPVEGAPTRHIDVPLAVHVDHADALHERAEQDESAKAAQHRARRAFSLASVPFTSVAFLTALALLITQGVAINLAGSGSPEAATAIAQLLIWMTVIPFALAVVALVRGPHRSWAFAAMIVSVIANPLILRLVLSFFGSL